MAGFNFPDAPALNDIINGPRRTRYEWIGNRWIALAGGGTSVGATAPASPGTGDLWYDTSISEMQVWNGSTWISLAGGGVIVADTAPSGVPVNSLWFNSTDLQTYIYFDDGTSIQWVPVNNQQGGIGIWLPLTGGTLTGPLLLSGDATQPMGAVTLQQLQAQTDISATNTVNMGVLPGAMSDAMGEVATSPISAPVQLAHTGRAMVALGQSWMTTPAGTAGNIVIFIKRNNTPSTNLATATEVRGSVFAIRDLTDTKSLVVPITQPRNETWYYFTSAYVVGTAVAQLVGGSAVIMEF